MASACLLHYGGDPSFLARFCGHEYTAEHRDVETILCGVKDYANPTDFEDMRRILHKGCPQTSSIRRLVKKKR